MDLFEELMGVVGELEHDAIEHALVGGLAVAVWGAPRATKDIDLLVLPDDVERAVAAAARRGFDVRALPMTFRDGMELSRVSRVEGGGVTTVDIIHANALLAPAWSSRVRIDAGGKGLWVVSRDALIAMKALAARPIDLADIEKLREIDR